jgi:hypothetical protein
MVTTGGYPPGRCLLVPECIQLVTASGYPLVQCLHAGSARAASVKVCLPMKEVPSVHVLTSYLFLVKVIKFY